ncbi:PadR family transcriptional regulator [Sporichthya sp.]|uniref:PadR family transcriptional regulator n=1 Tax=Sporichthya sp. TaxID=65475 RepID=UPI0018229730|nr:PadR family transcriptional regulator [Sporichthya sp.]MBA3745775.1 PadR family transcriptional regulator [Sporichthya sp.]
MSIRNGLLALLEGGPKYGYQLRVEFEAATGATWPLNVGQVYTTLNRLERDGMVEPAGEADDSGKVVYRITGAGRAELAIWFDEPIEHDARPRDELVIKLALAIATPGVDALAVIDTQRAAAHRAIRAATRRKAAQNGSTDLANELVAEAAIFAAEAEVRWLDHCEQVLLASPPAARPDLTRSVT